MTPRDILPYYLALEPSPIDATTAFALARSVPDGVDVTVSIVLEEPDRCREIFRFSQLGFVRIAWSPSGQLLAFAQKTTLLARRPDGHAELVVLPEEIQFLGFDSSERLWCLCGDRLGVRDGSRFETIAEGVESVGVSACAVYCRREPAGVTLHSHDGTQERTLAAFSDLDAADTITLSNAGRYLTVAIQSGLEKDRARMRVVQFDLDARTSAVLVDQRVAIGFNGGPAVSATQLQQGTVLARYERGVHSRVWDVTPGRPPEPISPEGLEVFDCVADAAGDRVAIVASDTRTPLGACQRHLVIGRRDRDRWHMSTVHRGVYEMPRWRSDGRLEVLWGDGGRWSRAVFDPDDGHATHARPLCVGVAVRSPVAYDYVRLPGPETRCAAVVLLPRLHQQFIAGAQSFFFHHLLFSTARELAADGYTVAVLSGPGAIGRGRRRREAGRSSGSYFTQMRAALRGLERSLRVEGCRSIGILAGSLAAVPAVRLLGVDSPFSASVFVAPLFEASIPVTRPCRHYLLDDPCIASIDEAAGALAVPLLVIQGGRDEVVPLEQLDQFSKGVSDRALLDVCWFEDEAHIFIDPRSWQRMAGVTQEFFARHLS